MTEHISYSEGREALAQFPLQMSSLLEGAEGVRLPHWAGQYAETKEGHAARTCHVITYVYDERHDQVLPYGRNSYVFTASYHNPGVFCTETPLLDLQYSTDLLLPARRGAYHQQYRTIARTAISRVLEQDELMLINQVNDIAVWKPVAADEPVLKKIRHSNNVKPVTDLSQIETVTDRAWRMAGYCLGTWNDIGRPLRG